MKALILGIDGYIGWSLACTLVSEGHSVFGIDNGLRRELVMEEGSISAIPIFSMNERINALNVRNNERACEYLTLNVSVDYEKLCCIIDDFQPNVVYHFAQIPSAPYSMKDRDRCIFTMQNNIIGTLNLLYAIKERKPDTHIIKVGTMGEYGTPDIPIPEGNCEITIDGRTASLPFPRGAGSWYHQTKVHDTHDIRMACSLWGLSCTDIMQGIVYGSKVEAMHGVPKLRTRYDFDQSFGTIINRFIVQAVVNHPLTIYGTGTQIRSILPLQDSINCLMLLAKNPPEKGEYREVNQFHEYLSLLRMAEIVQEAFYELIGRKPEIGFYENPRIEKEKHIYEPKNGKLQSLGYQNSESIQKTVRCMIIDIFAQKDMLRNFKNIIIPTIRWTGDTRVVEKIVN
jgi:UDP-sulfoquinovose synthase